MIQDGYTRHQHLGDLNFHYRPATRRERDQFAWMARKLGERMATHAVLHFVSSHIVSSDLGLNTQPFHLERLNKERPMVFDDLFLLIQGLIPDSSGNRWVDVEIDWQRNLYEGVVFESQYPGIAKRSCEDCRTWWFKRDSNEILKSNSTGLPLLREGLVACDDGMQPGCPKGHWSNPKGLNVANKWAYTHWKECEAVHSFPDDPIIKQNAVIIRRALATAERLKTRRTAA